MVAGKIFGFALTNLGAHSRRYLGIIVLSVVLVFFTGSVLFTAASLQSTLEKLLDAEPDFVVQKVVGDRPVPLPEFVGEALIEIPGIVKVTPRVYGRYFIERLQRSVLVLGIDFLDEQSHAALERIVERTDLNRFYADKNAMIVGRGVYEWMRRHETPDTLDFVSPDGKSVRLKRYATLPAASDLLSGDTVLTTIGNARRIFGLKRREAVDYAFNVPNTLEWETVAVKVASIDYGLRIIDKKESRKMYGELYDFKGGFFLLMLMGVLLAFMMVLYQRYAMIHASEHRHIGILRATGWSINDVLLLKFIETMLIVFISFGIGISLAYFYVFTTHSPLTLAVFLGSWNLHTHPVLPATVDPFTLVSLFLLFAVPFLAAVLLPVWRIAIANPVEAIR